MQKGSNRRLLIYTFTVFMILLRPFCAYYMTTKGEFASDPDKVSRILQRLIKKKETHEQDGIEAMEFQQAEEIKILLPVKLLLLLQQQAGWLMALLFDALTLPKRTAVAFISPTNHYLKLISRFQI